MENATTSTSNGLPLRNLFLLYIATCGLYFFYWFYKTSKTLYAHNGIAHKSGWFTLGLIVPILNIYLLWKLFKDIQKFTAGVGLNNFKYPGWLTIAYVVTSGLYRLPGLLSFIGFSSVLPILYVQNILNAYWKKEQPGLAERTKLTWGEILVCMTGFLLLGLAIIGAGLPSPQN